MTEEEQAIDHYERPVKLCLNVEGSVSQFMKLNGIYFWYFVALITMFWKMNIASVFYSYFFLQIIRLSYHTTEFHESPQQE